MQTILCTEDLEEVSGGIVPAGNRIQCTLSNNGIACTGSLNDWSDVFMDATSTFGGWLGRSFYDLTH